MKIDSTIIDHLGLNLTSDIVFDLLGLVNANESNTLSFIDDDIYMSDLIANRNISGVFVSEKYLDKVQSSRPDIAVIYCDDPRYYFYSLQNMLADKQFDETSFTSIIDPSSKVHSTAFIADKNVIIGNNVLIQPNVTILPDVTIDHNSIIRSGTVIGAEGFEHKRTKRGILSVKHDGKVIIGNNVDIGANCAISKGFSYRNTIISDETKLDNLVHIAHGVQIGKRCFLPAACMIAGSTTIGDDVWIGPGASLSSQINVGNNAFVTIGSVVTKNVTEGARVTGNFAMDHKMFLKILKNNIRGTINE